MNTYTLPIDIRSDIPYTIMIIHEEGSIIQLLQLQDWLSGVCVCSALEPMTCPMGP